MSKKHPSGPTANSSRSRIGGWGRRAAVVAMLTGTCCLTAGCYQRVVKDTSGTYIGEIHEPNLPDEGPGLWSDRTSGAGERDSGD